MEYSLVITTNARPFCLERLMASLGHLREEPKEIIVGDSTHPDAPEWVKTWYAVLFDKPSVSSFRLEPNCPPSKARKFLLHKVQANYVLVMDDDLICTDGSHKIMDPSQLREFDIVGGAWLQWQGSNYSDLIDEQEARNVLRKDMDLPIDPMALCGFQYAGGRSAEGQQVVVKIPLVLPHDSDCVLAISDVMPTLFAKTDVFDRINFDEQFRYFFEWYDFAMQARQANVNLSVRTGAHFYHLPEKYAYLAAGFHYPREEDKARFIEKWQTIPLFNR